MSYRIPRRKSQGVGIWLLIVLCIVALRIWYHQTKVETPRHGSRASRQVATPRRDRARTISDTAPIVGTSNEGNLLLGNPSEAEEDAQNHPDNFLLQRSQYTMSYNRSRGGPNWVAWHVDGADLGHLDRGKFQPDPDLPATWRITPGDYKNSGYDRGHVCPSGDRTSNRGNNDPTFYMSNMLPQAGALNRHVWADLEEYTRSLVRNDNEIYQTAGGLGDGGTIGDGKVKIPTKCWKVIVVLPVGEKDLSRIDAKTRVIAVEMPNIESKEVEGADWHSYRTSVAQIENDTKLKLFMALPEPVARALKSRVDDED